MISNYKRGRKYNVFICTAIFVLLIFSVLSVNYLILHRHRNVAYFSNDMLIYEGEEYRRMTEYGDIPENAKLSLLGEVKRSFSDSLFSCQLLYAVNEFPDIVAITTARDGYAFYIREKS